MKKLKQCVQMGRNITLIDDDGEETLLVDGSKLHYAKTDLGYQISYEPPSDSLLEAAEAFLEEESDVGLPVRKAFTDLEKDERDTLAQAFNRVRVEGLIASNATLHADNFWTGIHWGPDFLPWHRDFLRKLEVRLQITDSALMLPYWDWT